MTEVNPLEQFYRQEVFRVTLPSRGNFYSEGIVNLDDNLEVGILPMTAADELALKSPDALLTGKAVAIVVKSCVPEVKDPKKLLSCDIDTLMIAIRRASYGDEVDMKSNCPKCERENAFGLDLDTLLNQSETLDSSYEVVLPEGVTVFLRPGTYETIVKQYKAIFENTKAQRAIINSIDDESALNALTNAFKELTKLNFDLTNDAITKVVFTDAKGEEQIISNKKHISEFIVNIKKKSVDMIDDKIKEINRIGVKKTLKATCKHCEHMWDAAIEFNPVNFS